MLLLILNTSMSKDNVGLAKDFSYDAVSNDHFIAIHS